GGGDRVPAPGLLPGHRVVGGDMAPDAILAAGDADDHLIADYQRGVGDAVPVGRIGHLDVPDALPGHAVEGEQPPIEGPHIDVGAVHADAAVVGAAAVDRSSQLVR